MSDKLHELLVIVQEQADLIDKLATRCDFKYKSIHRLVLTYGKPFLNAIKPPFKGKPKSCFENCYEAIQNYPDLQYCEGYAKDWDIHLAVSHAWLVNAKGEVIDPTWVGKDFKGATYFGMVFNKKYVMEMAKKNKCYGILDSDYKNQFELMREGFPPEALIN